MGFLHAFSDSDLVAGCARVPGDEEEDGADDLEDEFNWRDRDDSQYAAESMLHAHMTYGRGGDLDGVHQPFQPNPNVPLLTNGQMVINHLQISPCSVISSFVCLCGCSIACALYVGR